uniref:Transmembrane matrix receptor MUP-4-like n=1 Tax=Phallusia mammillata TaxID=59560 RepID=A0A6F9DKY6_9ASCI|nr:transmembrane matrix receptor MUP-4-like [Phallusia mammillata]
MLLSVYTVVLGLAAYSNAFRCMTCHGSNFEECDVNGRMTECMNNQNMCETVVRRYENKLRVIKGCKNKMACEINQGQNVFNSGKSTQCNSDQRNSVCTCCCSGELCNVGHPTCVTYYQPPPANDCPSVPATLPHGEIVCLNGNKPGSLGEYRCTSQDYDVWPLHREHNICTNNGTWAHEPPCCARPCPPFYLYDDLWLIHLSGQDAELLLKHTIDLVKAGRYADDAMMAAVMYFSGKPIESSIINFNDYNGSETRLFELIEERLKITNEGPVNTGAAIKYALDNMLTPEAGLRDSRVPKGISLLTNTNSDDEVKEISDEVRRRGFWLEIYGWELHGFKFDRKQLLEIAGAEENLYIYDKHPGDFTHHDLNTLTSTFCSNPCDHVLHDHP